MRSPVVALAVLLLAVAAGLGLDLVLGTAPSGERAVAVAGAAEAGTWFCAAGDTEGENRLRVVAGVPTGAARTAEVRVDPFSEGTVERGPEVEVFPSTSLRRDLPPGIVDAGVAVRWWRSPIALTRIWELTTPGAPSGVVSGPCEPTPSRTWVVPGVSTAGGAQARLVLANPFDTDASLSITLASPRGPLEPQLLENVVVPRRSVREVLLNEHAPEEPDLGAIVRVRAGRVVAEAVQTIDAAIGGIEGVSLVKATPSAAETWTVPWFADGDPDAVPATQSWAWVTNPTQEPASLTVTLHTVDGGVVPEAVGAVTVEPGAVHRIDLRGLLPPGGPPRGGVTVRSENGVPVTVSGATVIGSGSAARTGLGISLGAPQPDDLWILAGSAASDRADFVHLANPSAEPALVDITAWTSVGRVDPPELTGIVVAPGSVRAVDLGAQLPPGSEHQTTFVVAREGAVVAGRQAFDLEGTLELVTSLGVPARVWEGGGAVLPVEFAPGLPQRIGTTLGPQTPDSVLPPEEVEIPTSDPTVGEPSPAG